ncbi:serine/threonine protein kinase [Rhodopirellula baltica SH28]|uniref:Serine/threonine protein kinase n=1 Tax=Rhodopirellula baltica SH28 TaxID=993517 RepID=K5E790_RHOBT|nr:serine/threonine-protein kinase [Rhodopirellula baltica]EKK01666.1 serine/threonine protein kinase [Rhodopirellula baltica SH28]
MPRPNEDPTEVRSSISAEIVAKHIGDYQIVRTLGTGGMGEVYLARHTETHQEVALKVLRHHVADNPRFRRRFEREANLIQTLDHDHIVPLLDAGDDNGSPYLAMQFVDGQTLADLILEQRGIDDGERSGVDSQTDTAILSHALATPDDSGKSYEFIANAIADVAEALHSAHSNKAIHRDVKPSNLIIDRDGKLWLMDFGLAFLEDDQTALTMTGDLVGTPAYMSPEQTIGSHSEVTRRSDVYSLGATLYEWATLHRPFSGNREQVLVNVANGSLATPRSLRNDLPVALEAVICKAMTRSPEGRYPTAAAFAEDLRRFAAGKTVNARMPRWSERLFRWSQRNPLVALASFIGVVATIVAVLSMQAIYSGQLVLINEQLEKSNDDLIASNLQLEAREAELSNQLFISDMSLAFNAFSANNLFTTKQLVDKHRTQASPFGTNRFAFELLNYLASPPSSTLLTQHDSPATGIAVSNDGKLLVSAGEDGSVHVVDLQTNQRLHQYQLPGRLDCIAISPDNQFFLAGLNESIGFCPIKVYRIDTGEEVLGLLGHWHSMESGTFSSDGKLIATADRYRQVQVHDMDGKVVKSLDATTRNESLAFLEDSHRLVYVYEREPQRELRVLDLETGEHTVIPTDVTVAQFAFSQPQGKEKAFRIVAQGYGALSVSDFGQSAPFVELDSFSATFRCVAISGDGSLVYSGTDEGSVYVWRLRDRDHANQLFRPLVVPAANGRIYDIVALPEQATTPRFVTAAEDGKVVLWETEEKMPIRPSHQDVAYRNTRTMAIATPHQGSSDVFLALTSGRIGHYNPRINLHGMSVITQFSRKESIELAVNEDASVIALCSDKELKIYDVKSTRLVKTVPSPDLERSCRGMQYQEDRLYVVYTDEVIVYKVPDYSLAGVIKLPSDNAKAILPMPMDHSLLVVTDRALCQIEGMSASLYEEAQTAADHYHRVAIDSRGKQMAIIRANRLIEVRSIPEGETIAVLRGHVQRPSDCQFLDNDQTVATTSEEGFIRFWDIASEREMGAIVAGKSSHNRLHYFKDFDMLLSTSPDTPIDLWVTNRSQTSLASEELTEKKGANEKDIGLVR